MLIKKIKLKDFRNYDELELDFNDNVNLILGQNAQGKTNLLESIYVTSMGKSFRTSKDIEMIRFGSEFGKVYVETLKDDFEGSVEIVIDKASKKFVKVDGVKIKKTSQLLKNIYIVIFSPEDLKIVKDEPEKRRKFIDRELCQIKPSYYDNLSNYKKVLLQRNTYLKENFIDQGILDIWDMQLARFGAAIMHQRKVFTEKINKISCGIHSSITNGNEYLKIIYDPNVEFKESIREQEEFFYEIIKKSCENDLRQRTTTKGPHKDDLEFFINNINVRSFGSQGQQRTAALSLKLAEISIIEEETGEKPVLLLDDVMSELDAARQEFLIKSLADIQLFVTTTEIPEKLLAEFPSGNIYTVTGGSVEKSYYNEKKTKGE